MLSSVLLHDYFARLLFLWRRNFSGARRFRSQIFGHGTQKQKGLPVGTGRESFSFRDTSGTVSLKVATVLVRGIQWTLQEINGQHPADRVGML